MGGFLGFGCRREFGFGFGSFLGSWNGWDDGCGRRRCEDRHRWWNRGWGCNDGWNW